MTGLVYHFTDTARLPWILKSGELRPGRNRLGGFPDPDFLWATTSTRGDRTASASLAAYRKGQVRFVRIALPAALFEPWREIVERFPNWTPQQVARLESYAFGKSDPRAWRCRAEPLSVEHWAAIETRGFMDGRWLPLVAEPVQVMKFDDVTFGVVLGSKVYASTLVEGPSGSAGYVPMILNNVEGAA